jgi:hypothetical protein
VPTSGGQSGRETRRKMNLPPVDAAALAQAQLALARRRQQIEGRLLMNKGGC